jgi:RNA polymerase-binding transcription factor DksA
MDIETYKIRLEEELKQVSDELSKIASYDQATGDWEAKRPTSTESSDENLAADVAEDSVERQGEVAALETRFRNLTRALKKMDDGTFATCELCSDIIEEPRLVANAAARTCITHRDQEAVLPL